jgi:hypothetical protein
MAECRLKMIDGQSPMFGINKMIEASHETPQPHTHTQWKKSHELDEADCNEIFNFMFHVSKADLIDAALLGNGQSDTQRLVQ